MAILSACPRPDHAVEYAPRGYHGQNNQTERRVADEDRPRTDPVFKNAKHWKPSPFTSRSHLNQFSRRRTDSVFRSSAGRRGNEQPKQAMLACCSDTAATSCGRSVDRDGPCAK